MKAIGYCGFISHVVQKTRKPCQSFIAHVFLGAATLTLTACGGLAGGRNGSLVPSLAQRMHLDGQYQVLYRLSGNARGAHPMGALIVDGAGALYGATYDGGYGFSRCAGVLLGPGCGTVFSLTQSASGAVATTVYRFKGGDDGVAPLAGLVRDRHGVFYGTTSLGGAAGYECGRDFQGRVLGCGTVFKLTPSGSGYVETVLYRFAGGTDGAYPTAALILDSHGALYGTTQYGGGASFCAKQPPPTGCGTVFRLTPTGSGYIKAALYAFQGRRSANQTKSDGFYPIGGVVAGPHGELFGTTARGGNYNQLSPGGDGTVFELKPSASHFREQVIYRFPITRAPGGAQTPSGAAPASSLLIDNAGALYGTTSGGGPAIDGSCGTVFKLNPAGTSYAFSLLHAFYNPPQGPPDGCLPASGVIRDSSGTLYTTTVNGGGNCGNTGSDFGCGTIVKLVPSSGQYVESIVHALQTNDGSGRQQGNQPAGITLVGGMLYGTTVFGGEVGNGACNYLVKGCGVLFSATP